MIVHSVVSIVVGVDLGRRSERDTIVSSGTGTDSAYDPLETVFVEVRVSFFQ